MNKIKVLFDGKEYFSFTSVSTVHKTNRNICLKTATLSAVDLQVPFKDFLIELNKRGRMLATLYINNKIYIENYITKKSIYYNDSPTGGTDITVNITDRFNPLIESDVIKTQPEGTLQGFISNILEELEYTKEEFINRYQKKVTTARDFIVNGIFVNEQELKSFTRSDIMEKDSISLVGEACTLANLLLVSNGYDTLRLEKPNLLPVPIFTVYRKGNLGNIMYFEKTPDNPARSTPSKRIILNSSTKRAKQDKNTSVVVNYKNGMPHIQKVRRVNVEASYEDLAEAMDFNFAGITAMENSFIYQIPHTIFDLSNNFFVPNRKVYVYDDKYGIDEAMTILEVGFTINENDGSQLTLNLTTQASFDNNASIKQKRSLMKK
jgi:hypothetical protein